MGDVADAQVEALHELANDLRRYRDRVERFQRTIRSSSEGTMAHLQEVVAIRRQALASASQRLEAARQAALELARRDPPEPYRESSEEWADVVRARDALDRAETVRSRVADHLVQVERAAFAHRSSIEVGIRAGLRTLGLSIADLERYLGSSTTLRVIAAPGAAPTRAVGLLPDGLSEVALAEIDDADRHLDEGDFTKGYSPQDLEWAVNALHDVVLPTVARGGGLDELRSRDLAEGRQGTRSYADTYSGFFGDSAIVVERRDDGRYTVTNGYHRIWVARRMGTPTLPARIAGA